MCSLTRAFPACIYKIWKMVKAQIKIKTWSHPVNGHTKACLNSKFTNMQYLPVLCAGSFTCEILRKTQLKFLTFVIYPESLNKNEIFKESKRQKRG